MFSHNFRRSKFYISPWMTIVISFGLMTIVIVLGIANYNRDKSNMAMLLSDKGAALIRSFEAGTRSGMMGGIALDIHLQVLLEETALQPDIAYIAI
ncbi:MAG: hypothetical protein L3J69_14295, partial [Desulfobacula sp.]|nr:hypothetical protein [Desulfobacula sp.]